MKEITKDALITLLKEKGFDPKLCWFYTQFQNKFEEECNIDDIDFNEAYDSLSDFLKKEGINEVLFFSEPNFEIKSMRHEEMPNAFVNIEELKNFLHEKVNTFTNCHVADKELRWIFTITSSEDFFISGTKEFTQDFIQYFKGATIINRAELKEDQE